MHTEESRWHRDRRRMRDTDRSRSKDKAVKRFQVRNMIETAAQRDMKEASVYDVYQIPKLYLKMEYCVSCAIHSHVVRCRDAVNRRTRDPPARFRRGASKPNTGKPMRGLKRSARRVKKDVATDENQQGGR